jgi:hypothetical protein
MERQPTAAFILTLLAGLWMLAMGGMMYGMGPGFVEDGGSWMWGPGMMRGMMRGMAPGFGFGLWSPWFGAAAGIILLVGSVFLYSRPEQSRTWGFVILVVSALNVLVGMGGLLAGALGVVGGSLAIAWKPGPAS